MQQTLEQHMAFENLQRVFKEGCRPKPKRYGQVEPSLKYAKPYDSPHNLKDWSKDKRMVTCEAFSND